MASTYRAKFDFIVLKPIWFAFLLWAGFSFYDGHWVQALIYLAMTFVISIAGASLHKELTFRELTEGNPSLADATTATDTKLTSQEARLVTGASFKVSFTLAILVGVLASHVHGWLFILLVGLAVCWFGAPLILFVFGVVERQYTVGRLKSIPAGVILFWLGLGTVVIPIIYLARIAYR
jgi:hypothetical protein